MNRLRAALLGLADAGGELYEVLCRDPAIELAAVADVDRERAARMAEQADAAAFNDYRSAVVEAAASGLDALFLALSPAESEEYLQLAARQRSPVFVVPPATRRFDTLVELTELFAEGGRPLVIARTWQSEPAYSHLHDLEELAGEVFSATVDVTCRADAARGWQGDARRAGGGALLCGGYQMVDALVTLLGVPDEVFAAAALARLEGQPRPYDTEDAMAVVCRYADDRNAAIVCRRHGTAETWSMTLHGSRATVVVRPSALTIVDAAGRCVMEDEVETPSRFGPAVRSFVTGLSAGTAPMSSDAREHLPTMATIRAAYLAVKTGQPESPGRLLELKGVR
jgi:predicted dehydrogenase